MSADSTVINLLFGLWRLAHLYSASQLTGL